MQFFRVTFQTVGCLNELRSDDTDEFIRNELELDLWPTDDIVGGLGDGQFVVAKLADSLKTSALTGFQLEPIGVVDGDQFSMHRNDHPGETLPDFFMLSAIGKAGLDDFGTSPNDGFLVISERALTFLKAFKTDYLFVENEYHAPVRQ